MSTSSKEKGIDAKQEGVANEKRKLPKATPPWSTFRNPRIVRVSRSFGGKDRHSKVCTVRGLRDRRIRLAVPTAIQLYDLQDRLGLSQPSKVIDWLLDTAKLAIDKLPPLQLPHGFDQMLDSNSSHQPSFLESNSIFNHSNLDDPQRNQDKLFPLASSAHSSFPAGLINNQIPVNSSYHWEASNHGTVFAQAENGSSLPSSVALSSGSQFIFCPTGTVSSLFPQYVGTPLEAKKETHFEWLDSSSGLVHHHQRNTADHPDPHNAPT